VRRFLVVFVLLLATPAAAARTAPAPVSIFYYPWYGTPALDGSWEHWQQEWHVPPSDIASNFYPVRGAYSSSDRSVVYAQMREIRGAGITEVVASWWGWGSTEDARLPLLIAAAHASRLAVAVQVEPYPDRTPASVQADVAHLRTLGITRYYVYRPFDSGAEQDWAAVTKQLGPVQVLAETPNATRAAAAGFQGIYTYDLVANGPLSFARLCARARALHLVCAPSVGPGYEADRATGDPRVRPRRNGATYDAFWRAAIAAGADRVTITSYNEWHEGTQIEPAQPPVLRAAAGSPTLRNAYETYDGAYGLHGKASARAYLERTAYWVRAYRAALAR
jgi:hypothetical protein